MTSEDHKSTTQTHWIVPFRSTESKFTKMEVDEQKTYGIVSTKGTFIATDMKKLIDAVEDGKLILEVTQQKTRAQRDIYFITAAMNGIKNRLYMALPPAVHLEQLMEEKPRLVMKIDTDSDGLAVNTEMKDFEEKYRNFMKTKVEPLLIVASGLTSAFQLANFAKSEGATSKFTLLNLPKTIKPEQITRLCEARGSHILIAISYMFAINDEEKGRAIYGGVFEVGRFPFTIKTVAVKSTTEKTKPIKRKSNFEESDAKAICSESEEKV
jgi:hypothetical protein